VTMVAMRVGDDDSVEPSYFCCKQLLAKIGPAIDEHLAAGAFHQD
jgi:hypothetical protein